ncbi:hypothetical protein [Actinomadura madurae]|uniref:hypothetical protein n=1 Tax=Actinomadura madurae TaxID=1993 RepID=UPI0020D25B76|nr:hypothetical protein [Actinomadura madurae]MCP9976778.1 hypothetical protein [Actinomadura madurae]
MWRRGLGDPGVAGQVRARLRRDFGDAEDDDGGSGDLWWEPVVEQAVSDGTLPALTGEAFGALDHMYALLAVRYADEPGERRPGRRTRCSAGRCGSRAAIRGARCCTRASPSGSAWPWAHPSRTGPRASRRRRARR